MLDHLPLDPRQLSGLGRHAGQGERSCPPNPHVEAAGQHAWERQLPWWHVLFVLILTALLISVWFAQELATTQKIAVSALYAALAGWYASVGMPALREQSTRGAVIYIVGAFALFTPAAVIFGATPLLLLVLCAQFFMVLEIRWAVLAVVAFNAVPLGHTMIEADWRPRAVLIALGWGAIILVFSVTFAMWIRGIIEQSAERAALIGQLEATRTELAAANHEAGVLAERERLAAEIHDTLAQGFTSVLMLLQAVESEVDRDPAEGRRHLELAQRTARENLAEARTLVAALGPAGLEDTSLVEALRRLVDDVAATLGITATFDVTGEPGPLPAGIEVVLLRATQEALANVRKHAGATRVAVRLAYGAETRLEITDNGRGFEPAQMNGFGLRGMRARVEQVGGALETASAPEAGTTTRVMLP